MTRALTVAVAGIAVLALASCSPAPSGIVVSGTVDATLETVTAPTLSVPAVNLDAGFPDVSGAADPVTGRTANRTSTAAARASLGSTVRVAKVDVSQGDTVQAGQVLAGLDAAPQRAALAAARADAEVMAANVGLIRDAIRDLAEKRTDLEDARAEAQDGLRTLLSNRAKLLRARSQLVATRPRLVKQLSGLTAARAQVQQKRDQLAGQLAQLEAQLPEHPELEPQVAQLREAIAALDAQLSTMRGGIAALRKGLAKVDSALRTIRVALPKIDRGIRTVRNGLSKLDDALDVVADLRGNLSDQKEVLALQAKAIRVLIDAAGVQLALTRLTSPVDGVVVTVAAAGEELAPGATVVGIRATAPSTVTAWLSPFQLSQVCSGDAARITGDWMTGGGVPATLTRISPRAEYPPTSVATDEVHLTRAVEVAFTAAEQLPAGLPVEISIQPCRPAAENNPSR